MTTLTVTTGFIAIDPTNELVVLSFRGSHSRQNWVTDLHIEKMCSDLCNTCFVHGGFWESWVSMRDMIVSNALRAVAAHPRYRFVVTGHSLGAALATLAAGDLRKLNPWLRENTELYTFGSPRVGNIGTVDFLTKQSNKTYRVTASRDPVPRVPSPIADYMHTSPEYWIAKNPQHPKPEDVYVLTGYYNADGNTGTNVQSMDDHRQYFGYVTKCDPDPPGKPDEAAWWRFLVEGFIHSGGKKKDCKGKVSGDKDCKDKGKGSGGKPPEGKNDVH